MTMFRDLNKNGRLDPYEDPTRPINERVEDLLSQMTLEEKAGMMMHTIIMPGDLDAAPPFGAPVTSLGPSDVLCQQKQNQHKEEIPLSI